mgnify:CR=1 FL=1
MKKTDRFSRRNDIRKTKNPEQTSFVFFLFFYEIIIVNYQSRIDNKTFVSFEDTRRRRRKTPERFHIKFMRKKKRKKKFFFH